MAGLDARSKRSVSQRASSIHVFWQPTKGSQHAWAMARVSLLSVREKLLRSGLARVKKKKKK